MKRNYFALILIFLSVTLQAQFGPPVLINLPTDTPSTKQFIRNADVDNDGKKDILVASGFNNLVRYFHNAGNFTFAAPVLLPGVWSNLSGMEIADLNNDGNPDMVTIDKNADKLYWQANNNGVYAPQILIQDNLTIEAGRILCSDFNGDGATDIVILNHINVLIFFNDGLGNFSAPQNLLPPSEEGELYDNVVGYFNDDPYIDIAISDVGFFILLNDGNGNFTKTPGGGGSAISFLLESADYNNDGLDDIVMDSNTLIPYQNSANGFAAVSSFAPNNENYQTLFSADLDNDGDLDLLSEDNQTSAFFWYENNNVGSSWVRHTLSITNMFSSIYGVSAADLDGDGDNDLIRTSGNGEVAIYENQMTLKNTEFKNDDLVLVPNPASNNVLVAGTKTVEAIQLEIYDVSGKKVAAFQDVLTHTRFDISELTAGHYFVKIVNKEGVVFKRLVVAK